jgi:hypothetical protein
VFTKKQHFQIASIISAIIFAILSILLTPAVANAGILDKLEKALEKMITDAGVTNATLSNLPGIIITVLEAMLFVYVIGSIYTIVQGSRNGDEVTHLIVQFLVIMVAIVVIIFIQNILF